MVLTPNCNKIMKRLLIIPARIGSKRIKKKNIRKFHGKPIIYYSIQNAIKSGLFYKIHVSTDSKIVSKISEKNSIKTDFYRTKKLSDDNTKLIDVYRYVVKKYLDLNLKFDEVWFLSACSPLVTTQDLKNATKFFKRIKTNSFLSINEYSPPIQWAMKINKKKRLIPISSYSRKIKSQKLKKYYIDNGAFGAYRSNVFYENKKINYSGFITNLQIIDIDNLSDWEFTEFLYLKKFSKT